MQQPTTKKRTYKIKGIEIWFGWYCFWEAKVALENQKVKATIYELTEDELEEMEMRSAGTKTAKQNGGTSLIKRMFNSKKIIYLLLCYDIIFSLYYYD